MVGLYTRKLKPNYTNRENLKRFFLSMSLLFLIDVPSHGSSKKLLFARDRDRLRKPPWSKHREQLVTECPTQQVRLQHNYRLHLRISAHQVHISAHQGRGSRKTVRPRGTRSLLAGCAS